MIEELPTNEKGTYTIALRKNCRTFDKRLYELIPPISESFASLFQEYGSWNYNDFKKINGAFKNTFSVTMENEWQITGVIGGADLQISITKDNNHLFDLFEKVIESNYTRVIP